MDSGAEDLKVVLTKQDDLSRMISHRGRLYITKQGDNSVVATKVDDTDLQEQAAGLAAPYDIAADDEFVVVCAEGSPQEGLRGIVRIDSGTPELLADVPCRSLAIRDRRVYFSRESPDSLSYVPIRGGSVVEMAVLDEPISDIAVVENEVVAAMASGDVLGIALTGEAPPRLIASAQGPVEEVISDGSTAYWVSDSGLVSQVEDFDAPRLLIPGSFDRHALAIFPARDTLLYAVQLANEPGEYSVIEVQTHSADSRILANVSDTVGALAVDEGALYWSELEAGRVLSAPLSNGEGE